jgi:hypothetical protein
MALPRVLKAPFADIDAPPSEASIFAGLKNLFNWVGEASLIGSAAFSS